jgi:hypothetical protein
LALVDPEQTSIGPLQNLPAAMEFLHNLKEEGRLPGWSKEEKGQMAYPEVYSSSGTFNIRKNGSSSIFHYQVTRASKDSPWKLRKAWRTDKNGHTTEEYPVP